MPTLLEVSGTPITDQLAQQVEGRSLVPFFKDPNAEWEKRILVHHAGGWKRGAAAESKYERVAIQNEQLSLVYNKELYDLRADPGESNNMITEHPEVVEQLRKAYDLWWEKAPETEVSTLHQLYTPSGQVQFTGGQTDLAF